MSATHETPVSSMPSTYDPKSAEAKWYPYWMEGGFFKAGQRPDAKPYTIVIPPPNVTGMLHIGHALDFTLQDILVRLKRMQGFDVLWLPGTDHAGIATQTKVEQKLRETGVTRYDLGREKFLEQVWIWKDQYANTIRAQWAKMGFSLDYSRERFTLDEGLSKAVREVFVRLYEQGLIYRGERIINWDPATRTALSDIEVEYKEVQGNLYHLRYPLSNGQGHLVVATTRPETMLGDTAVAVNPKDERYAHLIGQTVTLPLVNRQIPIIADDYVEKEFGSGAVKITPAHDPNDFEVGRRHELPIILVMDETGVMNANAGAYEGLDRFVCRKTLIADLEAQGLLEKIETHVHQVGHSERSGAVIEPYLSTQWFVSMKPLAEQAIETQNSEAGGVNFVPDRFEKIYLRWIENVRDWCISRQLWWGHRIPAWHCADCGQITVAREDAHTCKHCGSSNVEQDNDVLDTWFSSALWPFSTLGWPDQTEDMKRFYPTDCLVTGYDIIYFWVARMIFSALQFTDQIPFKDVLIHGLVRDAEGRKMSKSLGNGVDPLEVIEQFGADALRFMIATGSTPGQDLRFRMEKVEQARNFANKIWNASRFVLMNVQGLTRTDVHLNRSLSAADQWILSRLKAAVQEVTRLMDTYDFGEVGRVLYNFIWDDFCDWYIELAKLPLYGQDVESKATTQAVLLYTLEAILQMIHPFMPFLTEEIWQHMPHEGDTIGLSPWPCVDVAIDNAAVQEMELIMQLIKSARNVRAEVNVPMGRKVTMIVRANDDAILASLERQRALVERFCNTESCVMSANVLSPEQAMSAVISGATLFFPLAGLIDVAQEVARLNKELQTLTFEVERIDKKLSNEGFVAKAPVTVIEEEKTKRADYAQKRTHVLERLEEMKKLT